MQIAQNKWLWAAVASIVVAGVAFGAFSVFSRRNPPVGSFGECEARGYEILETFPRQCKTPAGQTFTEDLGNIPEKLDLINVESPGPGETVNLSPLPIKGQARGQWFFEGSFPVEIRDLDGNMVASGIAEAQGDWMTEDFVPFTASIAIKSGFQGKARLILRKDNPSGIPEFDDELNIPININIVSETMAVNVFFGMTTPTSDIDPCDLVYPVSRSVPRTSGVAKAALEELFKGPTEEEKKEGFFTSLPDGVALNRIVIADGEASVDFSQELEYQVGGSCRVTAIRAQIIETLKQFSSVNKVVISINGRTEDILQP